MALRTLASLLCLLLLHLLIRIALTHARSTPPVVPLHSTPRSAPTTASCLDSTMISPSSIAKQLIQPSRLGQRGMALAAQEFVAQQCLEILLTKTVI